MIQIVKNIDLIKIHKKAIREKVYYEVDKLLDKKYFDGKRIPRRVLKLLRYIKLEYKKFTYSNYDEHKSIIEFFKEKYPELTKKYKPRKSKPFIYKIIRYLFEDRLYNEFSSGFKYDGNKKYDAYYFVENLKLKTCPYCNRNYISILNNKSGNTKKRRPELDHFYPKSVYPFLSVNYFNLIPSCSSCNKLKSDDTTSLIHPYDEEFGKVNITYWLNDVKFYNQKFNDLSFKSESSLSIEIKHSNINYNGNKSTFQIEELYREHKDIVIELILKHLYYPTSCINELSSFGFSEEEIYRFIYSNYSEDIDLTKRPLSKLTKDIVDELNSVAYTDYNI